MPAYPQLTAWETDILQVCYTFPSTILITLSSMPFAAAVDAALILKLWLQYFPDPKTVAILLPLVYIGLLGSSPHQLYKVPLC